VGGAAHTVPGAWQLSAWLRREATETHGVIFGECTLIGVGAREEASSLDGEPSGPPRPPAGRFLKPKRARSRSLGAAALGSLGRTFSSLAEASKMSAIRGEEGPVGASRCRALA